MNLQQANFEDLLTTYYHSTAAHEAADYLHNLIQCKQHLQLSTLLRDYRERAITAQKEIRLRAATDQLMNCCSVMEIASLTGFVPELQQTSFGMVIQPILENSDVRRYYEEYYPTKLPQLFRYRLAGINRETETIDHTDLTGNILAFLELDRHFMEKLDDGILLRMLDSFTIGGYMFSDVVKFVGRPEEFINGLLLAPQERNVLSRALIEFSLFMQFCFDLRQLLEHVKSQQLLQSAIWYHYSYWFDIIGHELSKQLNKAVLQFLQWKLKGDDENTVKAVQTYVREARTVLEELTSRRFAEPVDALLKRVSGK